MAVGMCRLCASLRKLDALTTITDERQELCQQIRQCCQLEIRPQDCLPKGVCDACVRSVQAAFAFYTRVQESQESLALLFGESTAAVGSPKQSLAESLTCLAAVGEREKLAPADHQQEERGQVRSVNLLNEVYEMLEIERDDSLSLDEHSLSLPKSEEGVQQPLEEVAEDEELLDDVHLTEAFNAITDAEVKAAANTEQHEEDAVDEPAALLDPEHTDQLDDEHEELMDVVSASVDSVIKWTSYTWRCYLCAYAASTHAALQRHAQHTHGVLPGNLQYKCNDCQKLCTRYYSFLNHVRLRHHPALATRCDVCDEHCASYGALASHRREQCVGPVADYPDVVQCDACGKCFLNQSALQVHARTQHTAVRQTYKCPLCGKQFKRIGALRVHSNVHSDVKGFTCDLCGRAFRQKANLDVHMYSHINDKLFECLVCRKSFKTSTNLEKHALVHTDTKDFPCDHCEKAFRTKNAKVSHERTHTGEMPYKCGYCERRFRFRSTLMSHTNAHTGERPYSCRECSHFFTNWSNYNKHMKRRHNTTATATATATATRVKESATERQHQRKSPKPERRPAEDADDHQVVSFIYSSEGDMIESTAHMKDFIEISIQEDDDAGQLRNGTD